MEEDVLVSNMYSTRKTFLTFWKKEISKHSMGLSSCLFVNRLFALILSTIPSGCLREMAPK